MARVQTVENEINYTAQPAVKPFVGFIDLESRENVSALIKWIIAYHYCLFLWN